MTKCPICTQSTDTLRSGIKNNQFLTDRCDRCFDNFTTHADFARKYNRDMGKRDYAKDTIQRFEGTEINPEFVKAYPKEAEAQFGRDVIRDPRPNRKQY